ncbi:inositol-3-phosphate synthase [Nonomuraea bangladeshensis]|uniref:Inositol-3-phosphate synthase n=1 Tax=Nonomuraea bangladeshensis TaxID=404385 RepID=A0ABV3HKK1_9ACTN
MNKLGVWLIGARGSVATTAIVGASAVRALAAPLVLDLARLVARAHEKGRQGVLPELGYFFKSPLGTDEHALAAQYARLRAFAEELS